MNPHAPISLQFPAGAVQPRPEAARASAGGEAETDDGFGFDDFLDIINPLQHLPIIGALYRAITGDEMDGIARVAGGALFGGPLGFALALADTAFESETGKDIGSTVLAAVTGGDDAAETAPPKTDLASADPRSILPKGATETAMIEPAAAPRFFRTRPASASPAAEAAPATGPSAASVPSLSPEAFDALMRSVGGTPETAAPKTGGGGNTADAYLSTIEAMRRNYERYESARR